MPNDNATLKKLVAEAKDACRVKMNALDNTDPRVAQTEKDLEKVFDKFLIENLFSLPIPYDEPLLLQHILHIRTSGEGAVEEFVAEAKKLVELLEGIVKEPILWLSEGGGSGWNNQVLDALRKLRSTVTRKKNTLANAGSDPANASGYAALNEDYNAHLDLYRAKLKDNSVSANEEDVKSVLGLEQLFTLAGSATKFIQYFKLTVKFLKEKTGA